MKLAESPASDIGMESDCDGGDALFVAAVLFTTFRTGIRLGVVWLTCGVFGGDIELYFIFYYFLLQWQNIKISSGFMCCSTKFVRGVQKWFRAVIQRAVNIYKQMEKKFKMNIEKNIETKNILKKKNNSLSSH